MFKYYSSYALIFAGFAHLICCGLPILIGFSSIFANLLLFKSLTINFELLEIAEVYLFIFTTLIFLIIIFLEVFDRKIRYSDNNRPNDEKFKLKNQSIKFNIILSTVLYFINTSIFISEVI